MLAKFLQGRPRPLPWPKFLVTQMLTRDLFAVAKPCFVIDDINAHWHILVVGNIAVIAHVHSTVGLMAADATEHNSQSDCLGPYRPTRGMRSPMRGHAG